MATALTVGDLRSPTIQNLEIGLIKNPTLTVGRTIMMTTTAPVLDPRLIQRLQRRGVQCTHPTANAEGDVFPIGKLELEIRARDGRENFKHFVGGTAGGGPVAVRDEAEPGLHQLGTPRSARVLG